jgi:hypothetical protein
MNARKHTRLAKTLIDACGGLEEAASACRLNKSRLSDFQNPNSGSFMPADVIVDLEAYCGEPLYSREIFESRPSEPVAGNALVETHEVVTAASALLPLVMEMVAGKPGARAAFQAAVTKLSEEVEDVEAIADAAAPHLKVAG